MLQARDEQRGASMGVFFMPRSVSFTSRAAATQLFAHLGSPLIWPVLAGLGVRSALV
ncbi:MAG: hypothetical protein JST54_34675 [Deltaproteobacteria bacterium]|nr:hypothetical protein [Deltaproteobacteria bacterium]